MKKVGIQGIAGSFHDIAVQRYFGEGKVEVVECETFKSLCFALKEGEIDQAMMAIENTVAGSILPNFSLIQENGFQIIGEVYLRIEMNLIANEGADINQITEVASHPMAILQCEDYLSKHKHIKSVKIEDTAEGVKQLSASKDVTKAVIASEYAANMYNMPILEKGIETDKKNFTRFLILSPSKINVEEANKASVVFQLKHEVGNLVDMLMILKCHELNMTKIQSAPIVGKPYEYNFHIDLMWDNYEYFKHAMDILRTKVSHLEILGEYKQGDRKLEA